MSKAHRGRPLKEETPMSGRGTCPVTGRSGVKLLYEQEIDGKKVMVSKVISASGLSRALVFALAVWQAAGTVWGQSPGVLRELNQLCEENARVNKQVADLSLDRAMLSDVVRESGEACRRLIAAARPRRALVARACFPVPDEVAFGGCLLPRAPPGRWASFRPANLGALRHRGDF